jgi:hypothetical protein
MAMQKRRVANPAPAVLALVNPKGKRTMAAKKRSSTRRRRAANPKRRRRTTTTTTTAKRTTARRRSNPVAKSRKRYSRRRRSNPVSGGVIGQGLELGASGIAIGLAQPFIRPLIARFVGQSPIASAGVTLLTGYGLSMLAGMVGPVRKYQRSLELAGWTLAFTQLVTSYVLPLLGGRGSGNPPAAAGLNGYRRGMNGIAAVTAVPPGVVAPPAPPARAGNGMNGIAAIPGRFAY